jgi:hypothetical protein
MEYLKPKRVFIKDDPQLNETWFQDWIAHDPSVLGLGELELKTRELTQPKAGRLDLLLHDPTTTRWYEVEVQLGPTDPSHIIRTIEYWDISRKRYPQYDHCAVLVAEQVTSRFLNVVTILNGCVPLIAIQMQVFDVGENRRAVIFTRVVDETPRGLEEDIRAAQPATREDWDRWSRPAIMKILDSLAAQIRTFDAEIELRYNRPL